MRPTRPLLRILSTLAPLGLASLALAGCVAVATTAYGPYPAPPPPQAEIIIKPPVSEAALVWQPGHWDWISGGYAWTGGAWVSQAGHGRVWQFGSWSNATGAWVWNPARWIEG